MSALVAMDFSATVDYFVAVLFDLFVVTHFFVGGNCLWPWKNFAIQALHPGFPYLDLK